LCDALQPVTFREGEVIVHQAVTDPVHQGWGRKMRSVDQWLIGLWMFMGIKSP
jgi:hypothetical protein